MTQYNQLVDLESDYASARKKITDELESFDKGCQQAANGDKAIIRRHNQNSLTRKLPVKLCKPIPFKTQPEKPKKKT